jgi:hypothetical protein
MVYKLDNRKYIHQLADRGKSLRCISCLKIKICISKTNNGLPCVVKPKIAKPRFADKNTGWNVLQSIKNCCGSVVMTCYPENNITHSKALRNFNKNDVIHKKRVEIPKNLPTQLEKFRAATDSLVANIFVTKKWLW